MAFEQRRLVDDFVICSPMHPDWEIVLATDSFFNR
jgi:hypothetical protein